MTPFFHSTQQGIVFSACIQSVGLVHGRVSVGAGSEFGGQWEEMVGTGVFTFWSFPVCPSPQKIQNQQPTDNWNRFWGFGYYGGSDETGLPISPLPVPFPRIYKLVINGLKKLSLTSLTLATSMVPLSLLEWRWEVELEECCMRG